MARFSGALWFGHQTYINEYPPVVQWCTLQGLFRPFGLSVKRCTGIQMRAGVLPDTVVACDLWKAAALAYAPTAEGRNLPSVGFRTMPNPSPPRVQAASLQASTDTIGVAQAPVKAPIHADFLRMAPPDRLKDSRKSRTPRDSVLAYARRERRLTP